MRTYLADQVKGFLLVTLLGTPLLASILAIFQYGGDEAWWWCWIGVSLFMIVLQMVVPSLIMPLFNKFTPLENQDLKAALFDYARSIDFSLENIFVMDGSRRSEKSNAFFTGFGKSKRIVLYDTLVERHTVPELVSVLAHEMGHFKKRHILQMLILSVLQMGLMFFLFSLFISVPGLFNAFYVEQVSVHGGLVFFSLLYTPLDFFMALLLQMRSRKNEYEADGFAVKTTKSSLPMVNALKKLSLHNLSNLRPHPLFVFLHYSHPPVLDRIRAISNS